MTESEHADGPEAAGAGSSDGGLAGGSGMAGADGSGAGAAAFADVLRMLDRLPLSDAERAEAVRRLLADQAAKGKS